MKSTNVPTFELGNNRKLTALSLMSSLFVYISPWK